MVQVQPTDVVYLDAGGMLAHEGFTSGLLLIVREILKEFCRHGLSVGVVSAVSVDAARDRRSATAGTLRSRWESGIEFSEYLLTAEGARSAATVREAFERLLSLARPRFILMSSPAVFLAEPDVAARELASESGALVIHVVADHLFPTAESHDPALVAALYRRMADGVVIALTESIAEKFERASGISPVRFKNPFVLDEVLVDAGAPATGRRVGMVNVHPIKGRAIFFEVARRLPGVEFVIIKNWPDIDDYDGEPANVATLDFMAQPKNFYQHVSILLVPSLHEDGPTRVAIEAMLNRIPVVANRIGSIPDVGERNAILIDPPTILGFDLVGDVLFPRLEAASFEECVGAYCQAITRILGDPSSVGRQVESAYQMASAYAADARCGLRRLVDSWLGAEAEPGGTRL